MDEVEELMQEAMEALIKKHEGMTLFVGTAVNVTDLKCDIQVFGAPDYLNARLNGVIDTLPSFVTVVPEENSFVLAGVVEQKKEAQAIVLQCSAVKKVIWKVGTSALVFDETGWAMSRGDESLTKIMKDLLNYIMQSTYTNGGGTTDPPNNITDFQKLLTRIDNLLK